jgi:hypothetical protein
MKFALSVVLVCFAMLSRADMTGRWKGQFEEAPSTVVKTNRTGGNVPFIEIRANKTWQQKIGTPGRFQVTVGKWKLENSKFTMWTTSVNGKAIKDPAPRVLMVAKDQRSMTMTITAKVSRANPKPMKFIITYRKVL